ncbi:hypothetical protein GCM10023185_02250 [Hymenobacter saemangeumensis]|uniref:Uncharacterized protein n=1 Tax=Hymenobacter saemangeumensis TaxID=1084522 RepID=A0ABP8HY32_9BACT
MLTLFSSFSDLVRTQRSALLLPLSLTALLLTSSCAATSEQDTGGTTTATATTTTTDATGTGATGTADAGGTGTAAGTGTTDMSALPKSARNVLTPAEIAGILNRPVALQTGSDSTAAMSTTTAAYVASDAGATSTAPLVMIRLAGDGQLADSRDMARNARHKVSDQPSLGRSAFYDDTEGSLYVNKNGQTLIISVPGEIPGKTRQQVATQLGRIATGRM